MDTFIDGKTVTIVGGANAKVTRTGGGDTGNVIRIDGASTVVLRGLEVSGGDGDGVEVTDGDVSITGCSVRRNKGIGINVAGGSISVSRSQVFENDDGGIQVASSGTKFAISNNFIFDNGKANGPGASTVGGVALTANTTG
ncbi:MAG: right-handed parallel beta-helix repeat-containing protein, partial [Myxococcales bacterium]|nr:right-handed parallel beta-helix repeat-containing protein [Myxococcales bacterium]